MKLDAIDRRILRALQRDGRLQNVELAKHVGLSPSPCLRRVKIMEEAGVIDRYVALVNPELVDFGITVFVRVWLNRQDEQTVNHFKAAVQDLPEVLECYLMVGDCDFLLRVAAQDLKSYRAFQAKHLAQIEGVQNLKTELPMEVVKSSSEIPV
jgi:DNA-binding Lrp family transcriptional regulator